MSPSRRNTLLALATAALLALAAWYALSAGPPSPPADIGFTTIEGERFTLAALRGDPLLVSFWASTCATCVREIPHLKALHQELGPRGLRIIAVAMPYDPPSRVVELARAQDLPYAVALDVSGALARAFPGVSATPTTFLLGPEGNIAWQGQGPLDMPRLRARIMRLLAPKS